MTVGEHKAALSQELVQLHQMPLASEPKHSETSPLFFTHFSWSTGEFWVAAAEEDNKPSFRLPKNIVRLFPCVLSDKEASVWLRDSQLPGNCGSWGIQVGMKRLCTPSSLR